MSSRRNSVNGWLMIFSLVLLIVLQLMWLNSSWREARETFRKETNNLFRNTIFAMHDSLLASNIEPVRGDTLHHQRRFVVGDSLNSFFTTDSIGRYLRRAEPSGIIEVLITQVDKDTVDSFLRPLVRRIRRDKSKRRFLVHMGPDSLAIDSVATEFKKRLFASDILVPFSVHRIRKEKPGSLQPVNFPKAVLATEVVPVNPHNYYVAYFDSSANWFFLRAISPQILFSIFVTLLTAASFFLMNRSMRSQQKLMVLKNDLISNISHELKTPVSTISVAVEAFEKFKALNDPQRATEYLAMARSELKRLELITDKILQTTSFDYGEVLRPHALLDLDEEVRQVLDSLRLVFEKHKLDVRYETRGDNFTLMGSSAHLVTVVYNLLDNAVKYSSSGSSILIRLHVDDGDLVLTVKDNGIGIPELYKKKVFEKFFRVPSGDIHNVKGYGLGLSYVASVVENHDGTVRLESEVGRGTSFTIRLPKRVGT